MNSKLEEHLIEQATRYINGLKEEAVAKAEGIILGSFYLIDELEFFSDKDRSKYRALLIERLEVILKEIEELSSDFASECWRIFNTKASN